MRRPMASLTAAVSEPALCGVDEDLKGLGGIVFVNGDESFAKGRLDREGALR
jgi:hypothetical protein